ncbi:TetR/AcrR family transcriptional regulator [Nocardia salmonicida]|uniref:TetR/AcrR family transcriptional regulator n=1 Tax=Nocardia salmonicida TaxID=53431 RepID=UPI003654073F
MTEPARRANRGPAAAEANRAALIAAAREMFAEYGPEAPLAFIAKRAGVGKGSLYRHFPNRDSVVAAVFEDNISELGQLARAPETTAEKLISAILEQLTDSAALIAALDPTDSSDTRLFAPGQEVIALLRAKLADPAQLGNLREDITLDEVFAGIGMFASLLLTTTESSRLTMAATARSLLVRAFYNQ